MSNMYKRKVREASEKNRLKALDETDRAFKVISRSNGDYVTAGGLLFRKIGSVLDFEWPKTTKMTLNFFSFFRNVSKYVLGFSCSSKQFLRIFRKY